MAYAHQLQSPKWQRCRLEILRRDKWKCRRCGDGSNQLHVHHLFYLGAPWEMDRQWLITVCEKCHKKLETQKGKPLELTDEDYNKMYKRFDKQRKKIWKIKRAA